MPPEEREVRERQVVGDVRLHHDARVKADKHVEIGFTDPERGQNRPGGRDLSGVGPARRPRHSKAGSSGWISFLFQEQALVEAVRAASMRPGEMRLGAQVVEETASCSTVLCAEPGLEPGEVGRG